MRVLLVDDHAIVREGLKRVLLTMDEAVEIGEAPNAARAMQLARKARWDCALVDIALPGKTGLELLKDLKRERSDLPVLILSMYPEDQYAVRMLRAGASGYLNKESAPEQLITAIRAAIRGEKYLSPRMASNIAAQVGLENARPPHETLSDREFSVMRMMASGMSGRDIASELSLSYKTISTYRTRILKKLNLKNNAQLVAYAVKNNLAQ